MPRIARLIVKEEEAVYHVMSRTALDGYVLGDVEKDFLLEHIKRLAKVYFAEVLGFCIMGNHFHLLVRMETGQDKSHEDMRRRFKVYYGEDKKRELSEDLIPALREKWSPAEKRDRNSSRRSSRAFPGFTTGVITGKGFSGPSGSRV